VLPLFVSIIPGKPCFRFKKRNQFKYQRTLGDTAEMFRILRLCNFAKIRVQKSPI
jgi:hypothetical protein